MLSRPEPHFPHRWIDRRDCTACRAESPWPLRSPGCRGVEHSWDITKFSDTWFVRFMHILGRNVPVEQVETIFGKISFIIFNYDRCVEFFLLNALQVLYGITELHAQGCMNTLHIIHPYGTVPENIPFGQTRADYLNLSDRIKTYTEQVGDVAMTETLSAKIEEAEHIIFLGFAFHDQNMALLTPKDQLTGPKQIFGTAFRMSGSDVEVVGGQINSWFKGRNASGIKLENTMRCVDLFENYQRSIGG
jgi:hypothetical protein